MRVIVMALPLQTSIQSFTLHPWTDEENNRARVFGFWGNYLMIQLISSSRETIEDLKLNGFGTKALFSSLIFSKLPPTGRRI
jgi:hypothetical protein